MNILKSYLGDMLKVYHIRIPKMKKDELYKCRVFLECLDQ